MSIVNILVDKKQLNIQEMEQQEELEDLYQEEAIAEPDEQQVAHGLSTLQSPTQSDLVHPDSAWIHSDSAQTTKSARAVLGLHSDSAWTLML